MNFNTYILDTLESHQDLLSYVEDSKFKMVSLDVETNSSNERLAKLWGIGFCFQDNEAFYLPIRNKEGALFWPEQYYINFFKKLLKNKKIIGHNVIFDALVILNNWNIDLVDQIYADTILMKHCVDEERPFALKEVSVRYLGPWADKAQEELYENIEANGGSTNKDNVQMFKADTAILGDYCCFAPKSAAVTMSNGGSKYIEDILPGEQVITHTGEDRTVIATQKSNFVGQLYNLELELGRSIKKVTPDHPFLVLNQTTNSLEWKKVSEIKKNDLLVRGESSIKYSSPNIESNDFWWLLGFYLSEGHLSKRKNQVYTVFSIHKKEYEKVKILLDRMGIKSCVCYDKRGLGCQITICDSSLSNKILKYCGGSYRCFDKQITKETLNILLANEVASLNFISGCIDGDGSFRHTGKGFQLKITVTSKSLISALDILSAALKLNPSRSNYTQEGRRESHTLTFFGNEALYISQYFNVKEKMGCDNNTNTFRRYVRVLGIAKEPYSGNVYNITVDGDNSYVSNGIISHNCWDTILCFKLFVLFEKRLTEEGLSNFFYNEEVMPLYKEVTIPMKRYGFPIDVAYFKGLLQDITKDIAALEDSIQTQIEDLTKEHNENLLESSYPCKRSGSFPKMLAALKGVSLPQKNGKVTLAKKQVEAASLIHPEDSWYFDWLLGRTENLDEDLIRDVQLESFFEDNPNEHYVFNLKSNYHLGWLFFTKLKAKPLSTTPGGKPQCDDDFLESVQNKYPFVTSLVDYKKLIKLKTTYIEGILERQLDGVIYSSFLQFGTISGRYSSTNPNCQNLPRTKDDDAGLSEIVLKYGNAIKKGFVSRDGYAIVNSDFSALEPRAFASTSGDANLQSVFTKNEDLYSAIAKKVFNLKGSTFKKDSDYIGKLYPEKRQNMKTLALTVTYGGQAGRIAELMGISKAAAQKLIDDYLNAYPKLRQYIKSCHESAKKKGYVTTRFGRIRHLGAAKRLYEQYGDRLLTDYLFVKRNKLTNHKRLYKTMLNNSTNMPIQGLAAHIVNRSAIAMMRQFKQENLEASIRMQVHDELTVIAKKEHATRVKEIMKYCMENTTKIEVPLIADPVIATNWGEAK